MDGSILKLNVIAFPGNQVSEDKSLLQLFSESNFDERWDECSDLQDLLRFTAGVPKDSGFLQGGGMCCHLSSNP